MEKIRGCVSAVTRFALNDWLYGPWVLMTWFNFCSFLGMAFGCHTESLILVALTQSVVNFMLYIVQHLRGDSNVIWDVTETFIAMFYSVATITYLFITV